MRMSLGSAIIGFAALALLAASGNASNDCPGDCNDDQVVTVDEIIAGVSIALGTGALEQCFAFDRDSDGVITVDEIIAASTVALDGCRVPSSTPTVGPAATPTPNGLLFAGAIAELAPHGSGDELVYRVTRSDGRVFEETRRVIAAQAGGEFTVETWEVDAHILTETFRDDGLSLFETGEVDEEDEVRTICAPGLLQLQVPLVIGSVIEDAARCDLRTVRGNRFLGQVQQQTRVIPLALLPFIDVPAGRYEDVLHIRAENKVGSSVEDLDIYLVPGIGVVRSQESSFGSTTRLAELVDGTIGGRSVRRP